MLGPSPPISVLARATRWRVYAVALGIWGGLACSGGERRAAPVPDTPTPHSPITTVASDAAIAPVADAGPPISEAVARQIISARFRRAGFRVRHDVRLERDGIDITLDGFDVRFGVGFEYLAPAERGADVTLEERNAVSRDAQYVLIVDAGPLPTVLASVDAFLIKARRLLLPDAGVSASGSPVDAALP